MNPVLIEPTDLLFFRDAVPMSAGQGKGAGCRMPFPSTLHEAFRGSLLRADGTQPTTKGEQGRPRGADRRGNWHEAGHDGSTFIASKDYRSLRTVGPLPFLASDRSDGPLVWTERPGSEDPGVTIRYAGLLLPVPLDVAFENRPHTEAAPEGGSTRRFRPVALRRLRLWYGPPPSPSPPSSSPGGFRPPCLPMAVTPPDKHGALFGWWTVEQFRAYAEPGPDGQPDKVNGGCFFRPLPPEDLWQPEYRVGVQIDPGTLTAAPGRLYAGTHLRPQARTRLAAAVEIADPAGCAPGAEKSARQRERARLEQLDWLLLGGEFRLARLWHRNEAGRPLADPFAALRRCPAPPPGSGPVLLKWILVTPALFAHGSLPGWCGDTLAGRPGGRRPAGRVCLDLPGRAHLVSWCLGKPRTVSGWDLVEARAKPTHLAVPEGGVYYFLCESREVAAALARELHWKPRSDRYGEKGCGYGLVSFDVQMHPDSPGITELAALVFGT